VPQADQQSEFGTKFLTILRYYSQRPEAPSHKIPKHEERVSMTVRRYSVLLLLCFAFIAPMAWASSPNVVISQVYGGAGCTSANCSTYKNDYIELFNRGASAVSLNGWSVQYASASGTSWQVTSLSNISLQPGQYYLVGEGSGSTGINAIPNADISGTIAMSATGAKVALVSSTTPLSGSCAAGATVVDFVGYGTTPNCSETATAPAPSTTTAIFRASSGCADSDNNATDFVVAAPAPRNTASSIHLCGITNVAPSITAPSNPIASVNQGVAPFDVTLTGSDDFGVYNWSASIGAGVSTVVVTAGQATANVTYHVTLDPAFAGTATFTASLSDNVNPAMTTAVNIRVTAVGVDNAPVITAPANPITTVEQDAAPFTVSLTGSDDGGVYNWSAATGTGIASVNVTSRQGTATVTYTVLLQAGFTGTATFTASLSDTVNPTVNQLVNIAVTAPPPPANHLVISQIYGGGGNTGAPFNRDFVELYNPGTTSVDVTNWSIQYASASGIFGSSPTQPLAGVIAPGQYYLIGLASGGAIGDPIPDPNVLGSTINMGGTAGKVALVNSTSPLANPCVLTDLSIVDYVGYGTTASCWEGSGRAPAPSNTTAIFRKGDGSIDTNNNANDFITGAPNPRRTAPFLEVGPRVVITDPSTNDSAAPRDASVTMTFSEPVTFDPSKVDIACATTGPHYDATFAGSDKNKTWVITPNVNFQPGEVCTVTISLDAVHDVDTDDSAPNTDTLAADYVWSFTVATGNPPPYPPEVHLTFGNPSNAVPDKNVPNNYLMMKPEYALSYNRDLGRPNWVSWHLSDEWFGTLARVDTFRPDPAVPSNWYRVQATDFFGTGFDRGHMTPNADRDKETPIVQATFLMSNMVAQAPNNNQGPWADLENFLRTLASSVNELYIVSGPAGVGGTGSNGFAMTVANGHVTVPSSTWKAALVLPKGDNDVSRVTASTQTIVVIMPNVQGILNNDWHQYLTSVDAVENLTGYDLFSNIPSAIQNAIEAGVNGDNPPGASTDQSVSATEDVQKTFVLDVAAPNSNPLTYTIVTQPAHGSLSGSNGSETYTPLPDFNGSDSFTYKVSDVAHTSNAGMVTITVLEVNDPPVATDDAENINEDTPLNFAASMLVANDVAGPANEQGQTLTVTAVSATADTHGTVALNDGQVSYVPELNYNGAASFTYRVCDNGVTNGLSDPQCTTGTVHVAIAPVNDPPTASIAVAATSAEGTAVAATVSVTDPDANEAFTYSWTVTKNGSPYASSNDTSFSFTPDDNGAYVVSVIVSDRAGATGSDSKTVNVTNVAPVITSVTGPTSAIQRGSAASINVGYTDAGSADTHTALFTWDDNTTSVATCAAGMCTASHTFAAAGVYGVSVTLSDDDGGVASAMFSYVVVVDTNGGFLTGGGWISSSAGKVSYGFVSKYQKGQSTPSGNTELQIQGGNFNFNSTSMDWLVVAGAKAQYAGSGTVNGGGDYGYLLTVVDGDVKGGDGIDKFRIRIWSKVSGATVYDNVAGASDDIDDANPQPIGGGSIVIH
jgi:endonuclease G